MKWDNDIFLETFETSGIAERTVQLSTSGTDA